MPSSQAVRWYHRNQASEEATNWGMGPGDKLPGDFRVNSKPFLFHFLLCKVQKMPA